MALPSNALVKVIFNVVPTPTSSLSLIPGGVVTVTAATDPECDALIAAELEARKASNQANVDTLNEVLAKL